MSLILTATVLAAAVALGDTDGAISPLPPELTLVNPPPFAPNRTAPTITRNSGVLWFSPSPIGTRTPIGTHMLEYPGPAYYGAPPEAADDLILVRTREPLPLMAVSPYTRFNELDIELLQRRMPWIRRTPTIRRDVERAQHLWLKQNGLILGVRTHVNPSVYLAPAHAHDDSPAPVSNIRPRGVIKVHPVDPDSAPKRQADASRDHSVVRVSNPAAPRAPIVVLPESDATQAAAEQRD